MGTILWLVQRFSSLIILSYILPPITTHGKFPKIKVIHGKPLNLLMQQIKIIP